MINFKGLSHINIVVDDINSGIEYYKKLFNVIPLQKLSHFKNIGFAKSAGFIENPEKIELSIVFLQLPNTNFVIEMMEYHNPKGIKKIDSNKLTYQIGNVRRIALKVDNIENAFDYLKSATDVQFISDSPEYKPYKIDNITPKEFEFFDDKLEQDLTIKQNVCNIVNQIKYFIFIDQYGIQWELEQGNTLMDL
ncbi:bleomycin resistance protein [Candidatus Hepatincola sp. Pdp]